MLQERPVMGQYLLLLLYDGRYPNSSGYNINVSVNQNIVRLKFSRKIFRSGNDDDDNGHA